MNGKTVRILLGNWDRNMNSLIEASVLDACFGKVDVEFTRMARLRDFIRQAAFAGYDLAIVAPENLLVEPNRNSLRTPEEEVMRAISDLRNHGSTPVIVMGVAEDRESSFLQAGAGAVFRRLFDCETLKSAIRYVLQLPERVESEPTRWSLFSLLFRGWQRKSA